METEEDTEFVKGFNHGYVLGKHELGLLALMVKGHEGVDYIDGLREGGKQYEKERERERIKADIRRSSEGPERGRGKSR